MLVKVTPEEVTVAVKVTVSPGDAGFFEDISAVDVFDLLTTCATVFEVGLELNVAFPLYTAVMLCDGPARFESMHTAWLPLIVTVVQVPIATPPLKKVTLPVLLKVTPLEATVAVNVTCWLTRDGLGVDPSVVVVSDRLTTWFPPGAVKVPVLVVKWVVSG